MLNGIKIGILIEEGFEDTELIEPMRSVKLSGAKVLLIGSGSQESYLGKREIVLMRPDTIASRVKPEYFHAIIIPGGFAPERMRLHLPMVNLVKSVYAASRTIAAIGKGVQLLIPAGIVRGRLLTSEPSIADELAEEGAIWVDEPVVQDGNLITSRKPSDLPKFDKAIIESLQSNIRL